MHVSASPPLAVAKLLWQPRPEAFVLTVVCKATYALRNGPCPLLDAPDPLQTADVYWQDGTPRSLRLPTDLAPFKRHVDVMLVGHVWAPFGKAVSSLVARFAVGTMNKAIVVHGDRFWLPDGKLSEPIPFTRMGMRWVRAAGGSRSWNPVGIPPSTDAGIARPVPNFEPVGFVLRSPAQEIPPVGWGPLAPRWPTRVEHLLNHRATWSHEAWHEQPLPAGVDASYFNAAPKDQQIVELPAQASILLEHMSPEMPRLMAVIEDVRPRATVTRTGGASQEVWLRADTLLVDVDRGVCSVTWRAAVPLRHPKEEGVVVVVPTQGSAAKPSVTPSATAPMPARPKSPRTMPMPMVGDALPTPAATLPFVQPSAAPSKPEGRRERPALSFEADDDETTRTLHVDKPDVFTTLPFQRSPLRAAPASTSVPIPPIDADDDGTQTLVPSQPKVATPSALPFRSAPITKGDDGTGTVVPEARAVPSGLPFRASSPDLPPYVPADEPEPATERKPQIQADPIIPFVQPSAPAAFSAPKSMFSAPLGSSSALPFSAPPAIPTPPQEEREPPPARPQKATLSVERYARIKVDLWGAPAALHEVLARHGIDEVEWRIHEREQAETLAGEAREGRCELALALCAAFEAAKAPGIAPPPLGGLERGLETKARAAAP